MNTNAKGRIAELIAITKYISLGYVVLAPMNKDGVYDFVIERDGVFKKIQVKCLLDSKDFYTLSVKSVCSNRKGSVNKEYSNKDVDVFVGVDLKLNKVFAIPFDFENISQVLLRKVAPLRKREMVRFASDYELR